MVRQHADGQVQADGQEPFPQGQNQRLVGIADAVLVVAAAVVFVIVRTPALYQFPQVGERCRQGIKEVTKQS
jgi:hypothetical protein